MYVCLYVILFGIKKLPCVNRYKEVRFIKHSPALFTKQSLKKSSCFILHHIPQERERASSVMVQQKCGY